MIKTCLECKTIFYTKLTRKIFCQDKCRTNSSCRRHRKKYKERYNRHQVEYNKIFRKLNPEKTRQYQNKSIKKWLTKPENKLAHNLRVRINHALKGNTKSLSTELLLGCSFEEFRNYIELKFKVGMSWENRSQWHIDHIKPCCEFDLSKKSEQLKCFNYSNLQPLWPEENLAKRKFNKV